MKRYCFFLLLLVATLTAKANPVDQNAAREVGAKFLHAKALLKSADPAHLQWVCTYHTTNNEAAFYVFNSDKGFVIVSADDCATPILGYSKEDVFSGNDVPVQMEAYLQSFVKQIQYGIDHHLVADETITRQWELVRTTGFITENRGSSAVEPLLTDIWNQNCYYNELCPADTSGPCGHVYTGCVATSMAQILHYWGFPEKGTGSQTYTPEGYPQQTADFGATTYQWDQMPDSLSASSTPEQINAVATLMWHCGVAVEMGYTPTGSGAAFQFVAPALINFFNYSKDATFKYRFQYSTSEWLTLMKDNLDLGRPIHYTGGTHAFVCDGYDDNDYLHFNWGWGGRYDGYFADGALDPLPSYSFNSDNIAIVNIHPGEAFEIHITANPSNGGTVSFGGKDDSATYYEGQPCTVVATPNSGYGFTSWTEDDTVVSTSAQYTFTVNGNRNLVANFTEGQLSQYTVTVSPTPAIGGSVSFDDKGVRETFLYDFDDGTKMGWTSIDADEDGYQWVSSSNLYPYYSSGNLNGWGHHASQGFVCSGSIANYIDVLTPDNYLVSPAKGKYSRISFYACAQDTYFPAEHFGVAVSTTSADASRFTTIQEWTMTAKSQGNWYEYTVDLDAYSGQDIWVAIRHFNCTDQCFLCIDDIALTPGCNASYTEGQSCTVTATPNKGYCFVNWTKDGNVVSSDNPFTFEVTEDADYEALFALQTLTVDLDVDPLEGGVVTGNGTYIYGETANIKVIPNENYRFNGWFENGIMVSLSSSYYFKVMEDRHLVAHLSHDNALNEQNEIDVAIYPNPANCKLRVVSEEPILYYCIYDIHGAIVSRMSDVSEKNLELDVKSLPAGTYGIRLNIGNTVLTKKFVKE